MTAPNRNTLWARVLVDELARAGVEHATLAPGSRSTPLVLALVRHDDVAVTVHLDERSAAFHALGVGKATGRPGAVVTTSGTAAANLHPAVVEAAHSHAPLICLTADRPRHLHGTDANQTIDQTKLYGDAVNAFHGLPEPTPEADALEQLRARADRIVADTIGAPAGPVHVNAPFAKPLEDTPVAGDVPDDLSERSPLAVHGRPDGQPFTRVAARRAAPDPAEVGKLAEAFDEAQRPLLVAGVTGQPDRLGPAALHLARATGAPLVADPLSGARLAPDAPEHAIGAYDLFLQADPLPDELVPDLVLRLGARPTSKTMNRWLAELDGIRRIVAHDGARWPDHLATATEVVQADPALAAEALAAAVESPTPKPYRAAWRDAEARTRRIVDEELERDPFEATALAHAAATVPDGGQLFVGNSMPVRDLDAYAAPRDVDVRVLGNRGASGIDGLVSTALGVADASGRPTVAVVGDLSLLHDINGLHALSHASPPLALVVVDNDGGGIFHELPIREHDAFEAHFATPHGRDLTHVADLHGLDHERLDDPGALPAAIEDALANPPGPLIVVDSDRETNHDRHRAVEDRVQAAFRRKNR